MGYPLNNESKEYLESELQIINKWEKEQKGLWFWEKIGRLPFKLLDKATPAFIQDKIALLLDELGSFVQSGGQYLTKEQSVFKRIEGYVPSQSITSVDDCANVSLLVMNSVSEDIKKANSKLATVQGASTGIGGIFTLSIDIPLLLSLSLKTLQDISLAYGFNPKDKEERVFIVKCLQFATADIVGKEAILNDLSSFYRNEQADRKEMVSQLQGWREVVYTYRDQFGWKKLLQMIPIAGMVFGAFTNRSMIADVAEVGSMLYRKRRIMMRLEVKTDSLK
ncbi:EcsC family protein [Peribacillus loiseleuriae]|uniref:EcsC family protein n=1 Tax=Peribacillus loiseleuriae TaxID=1679170 RepID=UPI003CFE4AC5